MLLPQLQSPFVSKAGRVMRSKLESAWGSAFADLETTLGCMKARPFEMHLELTNICNANCVFCPYQFQLRPHQVMSDEVFQRAISQYVAIGGGSVSLTPIVGDALIDPKFLERVHYIRRHTNIDRIFVITNGILLDRFGIDEVLDSGLDHITISTSGFDEQSYRRIYRSPAYQRMRDNVTRLVESNARRSQPVSITIGLRSDRRLKDIMKDPDFQPILKHKPNVDFTWAFTTAGGRLTRDQLPQGMRLRKAPPKRETCVSLFNGPIVLPDGTVLGCSCVAAMDALDDLAIGNLLDDDLLTIWRSARMKKLRSQFETDGALNKTCSACQMYRNLDLYRSREGRVRAGLNRQRSEGRVVHRGRPTGFHFSGG